MNRIIFGVISTLLIIFIVPIVIYGGFSSIFGLNTPEGASPIVFLVSVLISKSGTAILFTLLYYYSRSFFDDKWLLYALLWWIMFVIGEVGQVIGPNYSWTEAFLGIISETIYLPLSVLILRKLLK